MSDLRLQLDFSRADVIMAVPPQNYDDLSALQGLISNEVAARQPAASPGYLSVSLDVSSSTLETLCHWYRTAEHVTRSPPRTSKVNFRSILN